MPAFIHHISTETPDFIYSNEFTRERMKSWVSEPRAKRLVDMIYDRTGIETRYSASDDFMKDDGALFYTLPDGSINSPTTGQRNTLYAKASRELAVKLAHKTLAECPQFAKSDITHVVFASCTGFATAGADRFFQILVPAGTGFDPGGIGKGYAADAALKVLKRQGIASALVAASGGPASIVDPVNGSRWRRAGVAPSSTAEQCRSPPSRLYLTPFDSRAAAMALPAPPAPYNRALRPAMVWPSA